MNQFREILICTFCFLLYMPNLFIKNFTKNKWHNLFMFCILFGISIFLLDLLFNLLFNRINKIQEGAQTGSPDGTQQDFHQDYIKAVNESTQKYYNDNIKTLPPTIRPFLNSDERGIYTDAKIAYKIAQTNILADIRRPADEYVKNIMQSKSYQWTDPPSDYLNQFNDKLRDGLNSVTIPPSVLPLYNTRAPTTPSPTTVSPTTVRPTTVRPTTAKPTTQKPTTQKPTTAKPTTAKPTTAKPTIANPTTQKPTTKKP